MQPPSILLFILVPLTCTQRAASSCCTPASAWLSRRLEKEGFHQDLATSVQLPWSAALSGCRLLLYERLPAGVYVDPHQLARLPGNQHRVLSSVDVEAMAHDGGWLDVLSWTDLNVTEGDEQGQVTVRATLPLHGRYHRADETERIASVYLESPRLFLGCDWENKVDSVSEPDRSPSDDGAEACHCEEKESLPCRAVGETVCEYRQLPADNSPAVVLAVPRGDLRDLELVLVGTTVAVTAGTVLLLLVISNKTLEPARQQ